MPLIKSKPESETILVEQVKTLILDVEKTRELMLKDEREILSFSYKQIVEIKEKYESEEMFNKLAEKADENWKAIKKNIDSVEIFYEIVWNRTSLELFFLTNYYTKKLLDPLSFENLYKNNGDFNSWWLNHVVYTLMVRLKKLYIKAAYVYANVSPVDIFEKDIEFKAKEAMEIIEQSNLNDVKEFLEYEWSKAEEYHKDIFSKVQENKRKTILFD